MKVRLLGSKGNIEGVNFLKQGKNLKGDMNEVE